MLGWLPHLRLPEPADYHRVLEVLQLKFHHGVLVLYLLVLVLPVLLLHEVADDVRYCVQPLLLFLNLLHTPRAEGGDVLLSEERFFCQELFRLQVGRDATVQLFLRLIYELQLGEDRRVDSGQLILRLVDDLADPCFHIGGQELQRGVDIMGASSDLEVGCPIYEAHSL